MPSESPRRRSSDGFNRPINSQFNWVSRAGDQNRAHSEQPSQKTGCFPYRSANSLLNAALPKDLQFQTLQLHAAERALRPGHQQAI